MDKLKGVAIGTVIGVLVSGPIGDAVDSYRKELAVTEQADINIILKKAGRLPLPPENLPKERAETILKKLNISKMRCQGCNEKISRLTNNNEKISQDIKAMDSKQIADARLQINKNLGEINETKDELSLETNLITMLSDELRKLNLSEAKMREMYDEIQKDFIATENEIEDNQVSIR